MTAIAFPKLPSKTDHVGSEGELVGFTAGNVKLSLDWLTDSVEKLQCSLQEIAGYLASNQEFQMQREAEMEAAWKKRADQLDMKLQTELKKMEDAMYDKMDKLENRLQMQVDDAKKQAAAALAAATGIAPADDGAARDAAAALKKLTGVVDGLKTDIKSQNEKFTSDITKVNSEVATCVKETAFDKENKNLEAKIKGLESTIAKDIASVNEQNASLSKELELLTGRMSEAEAGLAALDVDKQRARLDAIDQALADNQGRFGALNEKLEALAKIVGDGPGAIQKAMEQLRILLGELDGKMEDGLKNAADMLRAQEEAMRLKFQDLEDQIDELGVPGPKTEDDSARQGAMAARMQQQLLAAVKHIQHEFERVDNKVDDMWKRMPKIIAFLAPPEASDREKRDRSKEGSKSPSNETLLSTPESMSNKDQVGALTRMMQEALQTTLDELRTELRQTIESFDQDLQDKASIHQVWTVNNRLEKHIAAGHPRGRGASVSPSRQHSQDGVQYSGYEDNDASGVYLTGVDSSGRPGTGEMGGVAKPGFIEDDGSSPHGGRQAGEPHVRGRVRTNWHPKQEGGPTLAAATPFVKQSPKQRDRVKAPVSGPVGYSHHEEEAASAAYPASAGKPQPGLGKSQSQRLPRRGTQPPASEGPASAAPVDSEPAAASTPAGASSSTYIPGNAPNLRSLQKLQPSSYVPDKVVKDPTRTEPYHLSPKDPHQHKGSCKSATNPSMLGPSQSESRLPKLAHRHGHAHLNGGF
eukprot:TRINITY_DN122707_c0_g1_i1.p1 TRINITY_DN122707_c0_g1~~TRINITY_DN122707_c0_g1_i1.p1  ORF type:complete len:754 (+),score=247.15 TRINITY_DN122707_c0_g1_i1:170-2431(+)